MTSIAKPGLGATPLSVGRPSRGRALLLVALLALLARYSPGPWAALWLAIPLGVALALLAAWRFGSPAVIGTAVAAAVTVLLGHGAALWLWWAPAAVLSGAAMGAREEGHGPSAGQRAWMLAPVFVVAAVLPLLPHYADLVAALEREFRASDAQSLELVRQLHVGNEWRATWEKAVGEGAAWRVIWLPRVLPAVLCTWVVLLTVAGRALAARLADAWRWPRLSRLRLAQWRLPDGALWTFLAGLALLVSPWRAAAPVGWTLLFNTGVGYCVQGAAVVQSLMLARGVPPSITILTMMFVFLIAWPMFILTTAALGLSDVWLDYRRLEPVVDGDQNLGDR